MSNWTHVAGIIRIDFIDGLMEPIDFDGLLGKELRWGDKRDESVKYLPLGSEGSLYKSIWINPDESHVAHYTVSIFGDLRDHDSANEIIDWFKDICMNHDLWIRQASITVRNDFNGTVNWSSGCIAVVDV